MLQGPSFGTPELTPGQARALLGSLDLSRVVGLRDRAVLGVLGRYNYTNL